jgi:DNA-binding CsgD family transcriptional regulator
MQKNSKKGRLDRDSFSSENIDYGELKKLYEKLKEHVEVIEKNKRNIPLCVFSSKLSSLETIVKYLKENLKIQFNEISKLLGRSVKTIWQAYDSSKKKYPKEFVADDFSLTIPISLFKDRSLSVLEHIVFYLKNKGMKFSEIARALKRDPRTIWTVYQRAKKR